MSQSHDDDINGGAEDRLVSLVNWYDSRLRAGDDPEAGSTIEATAAVTQETLCEPEELRDIVDCIRLLRDNWGTLGERAESAEKGGAVEGEVWLDRFVIGPEIGRGSFGLVRLAHDRVCERDVALKFPRLRHRLAGDRRGELLAEAKTAALFSHPGILPLYDLGFSADGSPYFVMPYCNGGSLHEWLEANPQGLRPELCARMVLDLAKAMQYSHDRGIVHRDLKPGNILLQSIGRSEASGPAAATPPERLLDEWRLVVADFGLAFCQDALGNRGEVPHARAGTLGYMAPEQRTGNLHAVGPPADVYALGMILRELLLGRETGSSATGDSAKSTKSNLRNGGGIKSVREDLRRIVDCCTAVSPQERYASGAELSADLERYLSGDPVRGKDGPRLSDRMRKWVGSHRALLIAACGMALVMGGIAFWAAPSRLEREWRTQVGGEVVDREFPGQSAFPGGEVYLSEKHKALAVHAKRTQLAELGTLDPVEDLEFSIDMIPNEPLESGIYFGYEEGIVDGQMGTKIQTLDLGRESWDGREHFVIRRCLSFIQRENATIQYITAGRIAKWALPVPPAGDAPLKGPLRFKIVIRSGCLVEAWVNDHQLEGFATFDQSEFCKKHHFPVHGPFGVFVREGGTVFFQKPRIVKSTSDND
ncbi:MAG: serine/threonine-protein kinase [Planctomycetota bacterium]|nr:serine/threonine-protein kinase [Planctomycetota bacterium]